MIEPKCLKCGGMIEYDDCLDMEHCGDNDDTIVCCYVGHCIECEQNHSWIEEYKYTSRRNLQIEGE